MDIDTIKAVAILAIAALLLKRSIIGPQVGLARTALALCVIGTGLLALVQVPGDSNSWAGALFLMVGLLIALVMVLTELVWLVRDRFQRARQN